MPQIVVFRPARRVPPMGPKTSISYNGVTLLPGNNTKLSTTQLETLKGHPGFARDAQIGAVEILGQGTTRPPTLPSTEARADLSDLTVEDAEPIVEQELNIETLKGWRTAETRVTLQRALDQRIAVVERGDA